jgi:hypothetical protein
MGLNALQNLEEEEKNFVNRFNTHFGSEC